MLSDNQYCPDQTYNNNQYCYTTNQTGQIYQWGEAARQ